MGQVAEFEKVRKKRNRTRFFRRITLLVVAVCIALGVFYAMKAGAIRVAAGRAMDATMAFLAGESLPVGLPMGRPRWAADVDGRIAIADEAALLVYTRSGRLSGSHILGYQAPAFKTEGARILAYDLAGSRFDTFFWGDKAVSVDTGESIYCADLSPNGRVAIGSSAASALSGVVVYAENRVELFRWTSSELVMSAVELNSFGDKVAFSGVGAEGGEVYSSVCLYKIDREDPVCRVTLAGEVVIGLCFSSDGIIAVSDKRITLISESGSVKAKYEYEGAPVMFALSPSWGAGIVTGSYESSHSFTVSLISSALKSVGSWQVDGQVDQLGFANGRLYVVSDERFISYSRGAEPSVTRIPEGIFVMPEGGLFYLTPTHLKSSAG